MSKKDGKGLGSEGFLDHVFVFFFSQMNERKVDRRFLGRAYLLEKWGTSLSVGSWDLLVCFLVDALSEYL